MLKNNEHNEMEGQNTPKHFPSSTREWGNSIYVYNKNALNLIPIASLSATKIIKSYFSLFNLNIEKKLRTEKLPIKRRKLSRNRIFIGNNEFKHTNNKVVINLYLFNRQRQIYYASLKKLLESWTIYKKRIKYKTTILRVLREKRNKRSLKVQVLDGKYAMKYKKSIKIYYRTLRKYFNMWFNYPSYIKNVFQNDSKIKKYLVILAVKKIKDKKMKRKIKIRKIKQIENRITKSKITKKDRYIISTYLSSLKSNLFDKLTAYFYYKQLIHINKTKFNYVYLQYLKEYLQVIYNKNIEFNLINLKRFYLNSEILTESIRLKLTKNRRRIFKYLNRLKNKVKIKKRNLLIRPTLYNAVKDNTDNHLTKISLQRSIIKNIKHKNVTGFRLEARGRLTRRHTASRSVTKVKYKGNLQNMDSSYRGLSTVLLKGNLRANLQYTKSKSKTSIGSFGLKGWVSGY